MVAKVALLSVFFKAGIVEFATGLVERGFVIYSSTGTFKALKDAGVPVTDIAEVTGMPSILGHRVVTLHPKVHGGLLSLEIEEHLRDLEQYGIPKIGLVCVDLYPHEQEIAREGATFASVIEKIDIGGPTLLSSGAKGGRVVICQPADRQRVLDWLDAGCPNEFQFCNALAFKADGVVSRYRLASARYRSQGEWDGFVGHLVRACLYGENPWMTPAGLYSTDTGDPFALERFEPLIGSPSLVNYTDLDRLLQILTHIAAAYELNGLLVPFMAVAVKHGNPCAAVVGHDPARVLRELVTCDSQSIMGGVVMINFPLTEALADILLTHEMPEGKKRLIDTLAASGFVMSDVAEVFRRKHDKCRVLQNQALACLGLNAIDSATRFRYVRGGFLKQPNYTYVLDLRDVNLQRFGPSPSLGQLLDVLLAWAISATSNSNTITAVLQGRLIADAVGQQSRVRACKLAAMIAADTGRSLKGTVVASDSFFPFTDGPEKLAQEGVAVIFATSGSINDKAVQDFCVQRGVSLLQIPDKIARGFYMH